MRYPRYPVTAVNTAALERLMKEVSQGELDVEALVDAYSTPEALNGLLQCFPDVWMSAWAEIVIGRLGLDTLPAETYRELAARLQRSATRMGEVWKDIMRHLFVELMRRQARAEWVRAETPEERLTVSIYLLEISALLRNALLREGLRTLGQVTSRTRSDIRDIRGIGEGLCIELIAALKEFDLELAG